MKFSAVFLLIPWSHEAAYSQTIELCILCIWNLWKSLWVLF